MFFSGHPGIVMGLLRRPFQDEDHPACAGQFCILGGEEVSFFLIVCRVQVDIRLRAFFGRRLSIQALFTTSRRSRVIYDHGLPRLERAINGLATSHVVVFRDHLQ